MSAGSKEDVQPHRRKQKGQSPSHDLPEQEASQPRKKPQKPASSSTNKGNGDTLAGPSTSTNTATDKQRKVSNTEPAKDKQQETSSDESDNFLEDLEPLSQRQKYRIGELAQSIVENSVNTANSSAQIMNEPLQDKLNWGTPPKEVILQGPADYDKWIIQVQDFLMYHNANDLLDGNWIEPPGAALGHGPSREWQRWSAYNNKVMGVIRMTLGQGPREQVLGLRTAKEMWDKLKLYQRTGTLAYHDIFYEAITITETNFSSISDFAGKLRQLNNEAGRVGKHVKFPEPQLILLFLKGLGPNYTAFRANFLDNTDIVSLKNGLPLSLDEVLTRALQYDRVTNSNTSNTYALRSVVSSTTCDVCKRQGHTSDKCWKRHPHLQRQFHLEKKRKAEEALREIDYSRDNDSRRRGPPQRARAHQAQSRPEPDLFPDLVDDNEDTAYGYMATVWSTDTNDSSWQIDSAADFHMAPNTDGFTSFDRSFKGQVKAYGDSPPIPVTGKGTINILTNAPDGPQTVTLRDVWVSPRFPRRLISEYTLFTDGYKINKDLSGCRIYQGQTLVATGEIQRRGWILNTRNNPVTSPTQTPTTTTTTTAYQAFELPPEPAMQLWHQRLAHISPIALERLVKEDMATGVNLKEDKIPYRTCEACVLGKAKAHPHSSSITSIPGKKPLDFLYTDLIGPVSFEGTKRERAKYILMITDDYSRHVFANFLETKDAAFDCLLKFIKTAENSQRTTLSRLRSDNGTEFLNKRLLNYCDSRGIDFHTTPTFSPESNGVSERQNQTLVERVRAVMAAKAIPADAWCWIADGVLWLKNRCPVAGRDKTPYELWSGIKPALGHTRILGARCWVKTPKEKLRKFDNRASERILVGYVGNTLYRLYDPGKGTTEKANDVDFDEAPIIKRPLQQEQESDRGTKRHRCNDLVGDAVKEQSNLCTSAITVGAIQAAPDNISSVGVGDDQPPPPLPPDIPWQDFLAQVFNAEAINPKAPKSYRQAMLSSTADIWRKACEKEYHALDKMDTWELVDRPKDKPVIKGTWVFRVKTDAQGNPTQYKARWCARGDLQQEGLNYQETFSSVVRSMAYKLLFNRAAVEDLEIEQMDVDLAFLNSEIDSEVYIEQPEGFNDGSGRVLKLRKTLYGLKQSPRAWYHTLKDFLKTLNFKTATADASVFIRDDGLIIAVYIDDLLIFGADLSAVNQVKKELSKRFSMKDLGPCKWYLGISVTRNRQHRTITLSQQAYLEKVLEDFDMTNSKAQLTPMAPSTKLRKAADDFIAELSEVLRYQRAVGSLLYASLGTRPDLAFAVGLVSRYCSNPTKAHWAAVQRIFRYLNGTLKVCLVYGCTDGSPRIPELRGYTDASYGDCLDSNKSTAGYTFNVGSGTISWQSKRLSTISTSTTEAEYTGQYRATTEILYLRNLASELWPTIIPGATTLFCDNHGAVSLAHNALGHSKSKHFDIKLSKNQECQDRGLVNYTEVRTHENVADIFTKALAPIDFFRHARNLGLTNLPLRKAGID